jgi:hypothetical protein
MVGIIRNPNNKSKGNKGKGIIKRDKSCFMSEHCGDCSREFITLDQLNSLTILSRKRWRCTM